MDYLIERMRLAPASEVRVVTRPEKEDVVRHAERRGARVVLGHPDSVSASLLLGMAGLDPEDVVLFGFPDTIWEPANGFARLLPALDAEYDVVLGLFRSSEPERCDVVTFLDSGLITGVEVKSPCPSTDWIWACGAARARALEGLRAEPEPGCYFDALARRDRLYGVPLSDRFTDIGTKAALRRAVENEAGLGRNASTPDP